MVNYAVCRHEMLAHRPWAQGHFTKVTEVIYVAAAAAARRDGSGGSEWPLWGQTIENN